MTASKLREFQRRLDELARIFHVKPPPTREEAITTLAIKLTPDEDLMIVTRMLREDRFFKPANEREMQAHAAELLAYQKATELIDRGSKRKSRIDRLSSALKPSRSA